jgi:serine/threonine protein kinase
VVGILDAGATGDGLPFLVIEFIDGVTLRYEIQNGPVQAARAARLIRQIGGAVSAAHEKGVLHRDLKPENIMLERPGTPEEIVRLIDFGIARLDRPEEQAPTRTTRFAGTTPYMAPEQLAGRPQAASDIYALGVIAYEMLSGRRPFAAASPVELYEQQRAGIKRGAIPGVAPAAVRAILKQLSFRPENRAASAHEAAEQIALGLEGRLSEEWSRRKIAAVLASGAAVSAAGGFYLWPRFRPLDSSERVIEVLMGSEIIDSRPLQNADGTMIDSIRVSSGDQGEFFHPLSAAQAREAHLRGWILTVEAALEQGRIYWGLDNPQDPRQYSPYLERNADNTETAGCLLLVAPSHQGIDRLLPGKAGARRRMVMKWTPSAEAEFSVDGVKLVSGYTGFSGFRYARGLKFGATRYRSARASGVFWKIRLEIG